MLQEDLKWQLHLLYVTDFLCEQNGLLVIRDNMTIIIPPQDDLEASNTGVLFCLPQFKPWNAMSKADMCLGSVTRRLLLDGISVPAAFLLHLCPTSAWYVLTKFNPLIPAHLRQTAATNTITPTLNRNTNHKVRLLRLSDWLEVRGSILSVLNVSSGRGNLQPWAWASTPLWLSACCCTKAHLPPCFLSQHCQSLCILAPAFQQSRFRVCAPIPWANTSSEEASHSCTFALNTLHRAKVSSNTAQPHSNDFPQPGRLHVSFSKHIF